MPIACTTREPWHRGPAAALRLHFAVLSRHFADPLRTPVTVTYSLALRYALCDRPVELVTDDPALAEPLRRLFPAYVTNGAAPANPDVAIRRAGDGYRVAIGSGTPTLCRTVVEVMEVSEFALCEALLTSCRRYIHVHAAGAIMHGGAVLALGRAGAGKSSLAVAWSRRGHAALGDDIVLLDVEGRALAFRRLFKVHPALLQRVDVDLDNTPFWVPGSTDAWYDPSVSGGWVDEARIRALVLARYRTGRPLAITEASSADALNALVHSVLPSGVRRRAAFDTLCRVVAGVRAWEVTFGDVVAAAQALEDLTA